MTAKNKFVILISADAEWQAVRELLPGVAVDRTPYGEWFTWQIGECEIPVMQAGWGKSASGGAAQYAIDRWQPRGARQPGHLRRVSRDGWSGAR